MILAPTYESEFDANDAGMARGKVRAVEGDITCAGRHRQKTVINLHINVIALSSRSGWMTRTF